MADLKITTQRFFSILLFTLISANTVYAGDVAIVVNAQSGISELSPIEAKNLFLKKVHKLPNGEKAIVRTLPEDDPATEFFRKRILKKNSREWKQYWSRLTFSGKGQAPKSVESAALLKQFIKENENAIGYVNVQDVDDSVKVVYVIME